MALFAKTNKPRKFHYTPIYHDPRKAALQRRTEEIRDELIDQGELEATEEDLKRREKQQESQRAEERIRDKMHSAFRHGMSHLPAQESKGKAGSGRRDEFFRLIIMLVLLGLVVWFLYFRH